MIKTTITYTTEIECLIIETKINATKCMSFCEVYRSDTLEMNNYLDKFVKNLKKQARRLNDFNVDRLTEKANPLS